MQNCYHMFEVIHKDVMIVWWHPYKLIYVWRKGIHLLMFGQVPGKCTQQVGWLQMNMIEASGSHLTKCIASIRNREGLYSNEYTCHLNHVSKDIVFQEQKLSFHGEADFEWSTTIQATFFKYYRKLKWILEIKLDNTCKIISPIFSLAIPVPRIEPRKSPWEHGSNPKFPVILDEKATNYDNIIERFK